MYCPSPNSCSVWALVVIEMNIEISLCFTKAMNKYNQPFYFALNITYKLEANHIQITEDK